MNISLDDALKYHNAGRLQEAADICENILKIQPNDSDALHRLGLITEDAGDMEMAQTLIEEAIRHNPGVTQYHNDHGTLLDRQGLLKEAVAAYDRALHLKPNYDQALLNRGVVLQKLGRLEESLAAFDQAARVNPHYAAAHFSRGVLFQQQGQFEKSLEAYDQALQLRSDYAEAHSNRGGILQKLGRPEEALKAYDQALKIMPTHVAIYVNRGAALELLGRLNEALATYDQALKIKPDFAQAHNNRGNILKSQGRISEALAAFQQAVQITPGYSEAQSNYLFCLNYDPSQNDRSLFEAHRAWGERRGQHPNLYTEYSNLRDPEKTLRVGLVSKDFGRHPIGYIVDPLFTHIDAAKVQFIGYSGRLKDDGLTKKLRSYAHEWRSTLGFSDIDLANLIHADGIDILIDLAGHTAGNRLACFDQRPAPIQTHWAGYCHSIPTMDYSIWDPIQIPSGEERWFVEEIVRLPEIRWCYGPPDYAPEVTDPPVQERGYITFGSFNNLTKLNPSVIELWARLLKALPDSRLLLNWRTLADPVECKRFTLSFTALGIASERIELRAGESSHAGLLGEHADIDITLDPFPFSGGLTSFEALWMGLPVVTLPGTRPVSRQTLASLSAMNRTEWVAKNEDNYIAIALDLARNHDRLATYRQNQRNRMTTSPLCDGPRFVRHFEAALREMWHRWCADRK